MEFESPPPRPQNYKDTLSHTWGSRALCRFCAHTPSPPRTFSFSPCPKQREDGVGERPSDWQHMGRSRGTILNKWCQDTIRSSLYRHARWPVILLTPTYMDGAFWPAFLHGYTSLLIIQCRQNIVLELACYWWNSVLGAWNALRARTFYYKVQDRQNKLWNSLPKEAVMASNWDGFKIGFDKFAEDMAVSGY